MTDVIEVDLAKDETCADFTDNVSYEGWSKDKAEVPRKETEKHVKTTNWWAVLTAVVAISALAVAVVTGVVLKSECSCEETTTSQNESMKEKVRSLEEELQYEKSARFKLEERLANLSSLVENIRSTSVTETEIYQKLIIYASCQDAMEKGVTTSGVYTMHLGDGYDPFPVYCDMTTEGGGWTVFQRRQDGSVDFYRNWADYQNGFGDLKGEFWLGLDKIHRLTETAQLLRIDLQDFDGNRRYAKYTLFTIANGDMKYALTVGQYGGDAGDSLVYHNGMKFSTKDSDNDQHGGNCAITHQGAWWYKNCHGSNLNGVYINDGSSMDHHGLIWSHWKYNVMKFTEMKIRIRS